MPEPIRKVDLLQPGTIISGHYEIVERLGEGGMGSVFKARDLTLKRDIAIKFLLPHRLGKSVNVLRFQREAQATARLNHPGVVRIHSVETTADDQPFLVMDYIAGKTLAQRIADDGQLPVEEVLDIFIAVCDALDHAHKMGVLHRDLKPGNIIVCSSGDANVKVLDFGLAKIIVSTSTQKLTQTGQSFGTPSYMSPEMALGKDVDHRSDIYSLGCTLYEALTASPPYVADTPFATVLKHETDKALTLEEAAFGREFPAELEALVARLIAKRPEQRYQSMEEVKQALLHVKGNLGAKCNPSRETIPGKKWPNLKPVTIGVILGTVAALIAAGTIFFNSPFATKKAETATKLGTPESIRQEFLNENQKSADHFITLGDKFMSEGVIYPAMMAYDAALTALGVNINRKNLKIVQVLNKRAKTFAMLGKLSQSEADYRAALSMVQEVAPNSVEHYFTLEGLGALYAQEKKVSEAETVLNAAADGFRGLQGTDSLGAAYCLIDLGNCHRENHDYKRAEDSLQESARIYRKIVGTKSEQYTSALSDLARTYFQMGNARKAEATWKDVIKFENAIGGRGMAVGVAYLELAKMYKDKHDFVSALHALDQGLPLLVASPASSADDVLGGILSRVDFLIALKRHKEAGEACQTAEAFFTSQLRDKPKRLAASLVQLAKRQQILGMNSEAKAELKQAADAIKRANSGAQVDIFLEKNH